MWQIDLNRLCDVLTYDAQQPMIFSSGLFLFLFLGFSFIYLCLRKTTTLRLLFVVLFSYPALAFAALVTLDKLLFKQPRPAHRRILQAFIWSILTYVVAMIIPQLRVIFSLTGSLCGVALVFVWPAFFYIHVAKREKARAKSTQRSQYSISNNAIYFAWFLFYIGIILAIFMTGLEIKKLVAPSVDPTVPPTLSPTFMPSVVPTAAA